MPLVKRYKDKDKCSLLLFCQCTSTQVKERHPCRMYGRSHISCLHHRLRPILSQQDPQVRKIEICCWQRCSLLCLFQKLAPHVRSLSADTEICLPFLGLLIRPRNISVRSSSKTIPLSNEMGFGIHDFFFLIRKIPHSRHILMGAIFEKHKIISKDVVQETIWKEIVYAKADGVWLNYWNKLPYGIKHSWLLH